MSTISKVFTVVNLALALFMLGSVGAILAHGVDFKEKYDAEVAAHAQTKTDLEAQVSSLTEAKDNLEKETRSLTNQKNDLEATNQTLTAERDSVKADNTQLRNAVDGLNASYASLQNTLNDVQGRNQQLMDSNEDYRKTTAAAEQAKMQAEDDRARLEGDLDQSEADNAELQRQMVALVGERDNLLAEREALLASGVAITDIIGGTFPLIEGTVSDVGTGFVVLSVGENDGVKVGYPFDVHRGGSYIGQVVVSHVYPDNAIARVHMANDQGMEFKPLDSATTRLQ